MTTTSDFIRDMRELCEKATPQPWKHWPMLSGSENHRGYKVAADTQVAEVFPLDQDGVEGGHNATFIAAARTALPEALDRLERLEKVKALSSAYFKALETGPDIPEDCPEEEFQERCDAFGRVTDDLFGAVLKALREAEEEK